MQKQDTTGSIPLYYAFKGQAEKICTLIGKQGGNGGKRCFAAIETGTRVGGRKVYAICFLPAEYRIDGKKVEIGNGPNTDIMSGWIRGVIYASERFSPSLVQKLMP